METPELINAAQQLTDQAHDKLVAGLPDQAKANMSTLLDLLTKEFSTEAPAEPEKPTPDGVA